MIQKVQYRGKTYTVYPSSRKDKQKKVYVDGKWIHFGDPNMKEYPGTSRGNNYCTRSYGIKKMNGRSTTDDVNSPNFWSRKVLWKCSGKKSMR